MAKSPCRGECQLVSDVCRGCFRTLDEITRWSRMTETEQQTVLTALAVRKSGHDMPTSVALWVPEQHAEQALAVCPQCGEPSGCAISKGERAETCWCMSLPVVTVVVRHDSCWCLRCLTHQQSMIGNFENG